MERKKTLSIVSTILMTIYAVLVTIFNLWMFAMAAVLGQLVGKNSTERLMIDGTDFSGIVFGTGAIASAVMLLIAFVLLIVTIVLIIATVLSYKFIGNGKFTSDAWMKIVIFGIAFLVFVLTTSSTGLMAFCGAVFLALPIGLSVVVICDDSESDDNESDDSESDDSESDDSESDDNESDDSESDDNESDDNESDDNESDDEKEPVAKEPEKDSEEKESEI